MFEWKSGDASMSTKHGRYDIKTERYGVLATVNNFSDGVVVICIGASVESAKVACELDYLKREQEHQLKALLNISKDLASATTAEGQS